MFIWNVENMELLKQTGGVYIGREKIYACEYKLTREEKIEFVDSLQNGGLSYMLALLEKFDAEKDSLPKNNYGGIKTVSLKAWLKRNDTRGYVDRDYLHGSLRFLHCNRHLERWNQKSYIELHNDYVDEIFHRQLKECERLERKYFSEHDEYEVLKKTFLDKQRQYGTSFGVHISYSSSTVSVVGEDDRKRDITINELKDLIGKYERLDKLVEELSAETDIVF